MLPAFFMLAVMHAGAPFWLAVVVGIIASLILLGLGFKLLLVDPMLRHGVLPLAIATMALAVRMKEAVKQFFSAEASPFPSVVPVGDISVVRPAGVAAEHLRAGRRNPGRGRAYDDAVADLDRSPDAGCGAKSDRCADHRRARRTDGHADVPHQRAAGGNRVVLDLADLSRKILQWRGDRSLRLHRGDRRRLQPGARRARRRPIVGVVDNLAAAYVSSQYRAAVPLALLVAIILYSPQGLLGRAEERTV